MCKRLAVRTVMLFRARTKLAFNHTTTSALKICNIRSVQFSLFVSPQTLQSEHAHSIYFKKINVARDNVCQSDADKLSK